MKNMRLMIDANIILDVLQKREPFYLDSSKVLKMCETNMAEGHLSTLTFTNLVYIMRRELNSEKIEQVLKTLSLICCFDDLALSDIINAASIQWDDFEDAVQATIAKRINADYIITRNVKDYRKCSIIAMTPSEFFARI